MAIAASTIAQPIIQADRARHEARLTGGADGGIFTLERADQITGPWLPVQNQYITETATVFPLPDLGTSGVAFLRGVSRDLGTGGDAFQNLIEAYGILDTVAGAGGAPFDINKWDPAFEGGPATDALLSNPHFAMADKAGNIYIADKQSHAIRKVSPDGIITTAAGTSEKGNGTDKPTPATEVALNQPNGLWVRGDGTVYILDTGNDKVRRLSPDGTLRTLFSVSQGVSTGRGIWVRDDEGLAYVACGTTVKKWTPSKSARDFSTGYAELGNLVVDPGGNLVVTDRNGHRVYRVDSTGAQTPIAGNGTGFGGGDGYDALETGLLEVRGVWFLPNGSYFLATHRGSQVWYVDVDGIIHLFLHGYRSGSRRGDGSYFYAPQDARVSEVRAITMDWQGNLLITENDAGFVRKVTFLPYIE
ncbi:MAG: hypothetical protein HYR88_02445 [Verrucomicrobia bacterium]|nr:hypothetical protein [Verrucomicrobiota bacterium]